MVKLYGNEVAMRIMGPKQKLAADALATAQQKLQMQREQLQQLQADKQNLMQEYPESSGNDVSDKAAQELKLAQFARDIEQKKVSIARGVNICEQKRREWVMCNKKIKTVENSQHRQDLRKITIKKDNNKPVR